MSGARKRFRTDMKNKYFDNLEMTDNLQSYFGDGYVISDSLHAANYRFDLSINSEIIAERFKVNLENVSVIQTDNAVKNFVWIEKVPYPANSLQAKAVIQKEMARPLSEGFPYIRVVLFVCLENILDVVIVAHLAFFDKAVLDSLCLSAYSEEKFIYKQPKEFFGVAPHDLPLIKADFSPLPDWRGEGSERKKIKIDLGVYRENENQETISGFLAALMTVWARFSSIFNPVVAMHDGRSDGVGGWSLVPISLQKDMTAQNLKSEIKQSFTKPIWRTSKLADRLKNCENGGVVSVGAVIYESFSRILNSTISCKYEPFVEMPYPLMLMIEDQGAGCFSIHGIANGNIFNLERVEQFFHSVKHVYALLNSDNRLKLRLFPLLSEQEQKKVIKLGINSDLRDIPNERLEEIFTQQAKRSPNAIALSYNNEQMTYSQLEEKAALMALNLVAQNIQPGDRVGICLERSFDLIAAMLAILKAGAIYIPMDPAYPADRLEYICDNSTIYLVITDLKSFPTKNDRRLITPKELEKAMDAELWLPSSNILNSSDSAYVIYTSGSTGKPKGVLVPHKNVVSLLAATKKNFELTESDVWTFFHSAAFDFSIWEIWGSLLTGAHLLIVPYWISRDPDEFVELVRDKKVTVLNQTPSAFFQFMEVERTGSLLKHLRLIIFGGESLNAKILLKWFDRYPETVCRVVNMFGITETTVHVTAQTVTREEAMCGSRSVGRAIPGWRLYVLDENQNVLPPGVSGEIYVAGEGVASEYLNRPDLTKERFIFDCFNNGKMYRSGDKGRLLSCGRLEHLGRLDNQIKLRGFRIELDEIHKVLLSIFGVDSAAVIFNQSDENDPASARLDCYLVLSNIALDDVIIKSKKILPVYMVPSTFTQIEVMPLTSNGKLDVKKLPDPFSNNAKSCVLAKDMLESKESIAVDINLNTNTVKKEKAVLISKMVTVWSKILGREVRVTDNFFNLGGNSLYAVRIAAAMREVGLPAFPMRDLYVFQTIEKLAPAIIGS